MYEATFTQTALNAAAQVPEPQQRDLFATLWNTLKYNTPVDASDIAFYMRLLYTGAVLEKRGNPVRVGSDLKFVLDTTFKALDAGFYRHALTMLHLYRQMQKQLTVVYRTQRLIDHKLDWTDAGLQALVSIVAPPHYVENLATEAAAHPKTEAGLAALTRWIAETRYGIPTRNALQRVLARGGVAPAAPSGPKSASGAPGAPAAMSAGTKAALVAVGLLGLAGGWWYLRRGSKARAAPD